MKPIRTPFQTMTNIVSRSLGGTLAAGAGAALLLWSAPAEALETIIIRYNQDEVTVTLDDIINFGRTGDLPELEQLLMDQEDILQEAAEDVLNVLQDALTEEVRLSSRLRQDIANFLNSSTGEFVVLQLNRVISNADDTDDIDSLRSALINVYETNEFVSFLTLLEAYPDDIVRVDATGLEGVVRDVDLFVNQIEPALNVIRDLLQDFVCEPREQSQGPANRESASTLEMQTGLQVNVSESGLVLEPSDSQFAQTPVH
jgi:hypothetical protein